MVFKKLGSKIKSMKISASKGHLNQMDEQGANTLSKSEVPSSQMNQNSQDIILSNETIFNELIVKLRNQVGNSLINSSILSLDRGITVVKYNSDDTSNLLLCSMTKFFIEEITKTTYKGKHIKDYYVMDLKNNHLCLVLLLGEYCWSIVIEKTDLTIGMMLNVIVPNLIEEFHTTLETIRLLDIKETT